MTLAERLSEFVAGLQFDDLPPDVVASVRLRALDILGIALASSTSELAPSVLGAVEGWGGGACSVVGSRLTAASPVAALANGALAHGLDFEAPAAHSVRRPVQPGLLGRRGAGGRPRRARHVHEGPDSRRAHPGAGRPCRAHRRSDRALPRWVPRLGPRSSPRRPARRGAGARWARGRGAASQARRDRRQVPRQCAACAPSRPGGGDRAGRPVARLAGRRRDAPGRVSRVT
ncbi:MAG: hypothetical protein DMD87_07535 [Candidatus Rokuibacteriota bacterium]|nr:MAG: hypothetical protein DMD87_07535 [Candidatus Rokubacteria bacterium]